MNLIDHLMQLAQDPSIHQLGLLAWLTLRVEQLHRNDRRQDKRIHRLELEVGVRVPASIEARAR